MEIDPAHLLLQSFIKGSPSSKLPHSPHNQESGAACVIVGAYDRITEARRRRIVA